MSCCELVDRPLGEATESGWHITRRGDGHASPVHGGQDLPQHISSYTERLLTYQSDVLRAMQGLFSYFATPSIGKADRRLQFWGICVSPEAYSFTHDSYSVNEKLRLALAQGLCWNRSSDEVMLEQLDTKRRNGFPSWSWSGWNIPIKWDRLDRIEDLSRWNFLYAVSLEKRNGTQVPFTAALAEQICTMSSEGTDYTYRLHLQIEIMDIGVTYLSLEGILGPLQSGKRSKYVVRAMAHDTTSSSRRDNEQSYERPDVSPEQTVYWPIDITPYIEEGGELHQRLCQDVLRCVGLPNGYGLVVLAVGSVFERVGLMYLYGRREATLSGEVEWSEHIRKYFPSSIRKIVLG